MIVEKLEVLDYEPLLLRLIPVKGAVLPAKAIERFVFNWLGKRETHPVCQSGCRFKYVDVSKMYEWTVLAVQWLCPDCMDVLFPALAARFPKIERLKVGFSKDEPVPAALAPQAPPPMEVTFKSRLVTFEDGRTEQVEDFKIINRAVTVEEMQGFCTATGYVTSGERQECSDIYKDNAFLTVQEPEHRASYRANFLSYRDASAYCSWAGHRLMTEGEVFVARLIDDAVHATLPNADQIRAWWLNGTIIAAGGDVITSTKVGELIVVRRGPTVVKRPDWKEDIDRKLVGLDEPIGIIVPVLMND
jgi:hypothetical protein